MQTLVGGLVMGVIGSITTWVGFAFLLGWQGQPVALALVLLAIGPAAILMTIRMLRPRLTYGYGIAGGAFLACAAGIGLKLPELLRIENQQDLRLLWTTMGAGVSIFFGLACWIAAAMAKLMARDGS